MKTKTRNAMVLSFLGALALGSALWLGASRALVAEEKPAGAWVCPMPEHAEEFAAPGSCPACGMDLVRKAAVRSGQSGGMAEPAVGRVAILLFEGVQIIDYTGPYEVFGHAGYEVYTVAAKREPLTTAMGMTVTPRYTLEDAPPAEVLVIPGGNVEPTSGDPKVISWIRGRAAQAKVVLSVCNGAFILAETGLLDGKEATTFAALIDDLRRAAPKVRVVDDKRFVDNGKTVTAAGLSSGIDASLHVVEKLLGRGRAQVIATTLEYDWDPEGRYVRAALADKHLRTAYDALRQTERKPLAHAGDRERWETRWQVTTDLPAADFAARLGRDLEAGGWVRRAAGGAGGWTFQDAEGRAWTGEAAVDPAPGEAGKLLVSVRVARAATTATR